MRRAPRARALLLGLGLAAACGAPAEPGPGAEQPAPEPERPAEQLPPDTTSPQVLILSPREGQRGAVHQVRVQGEALDERGVVGLTASLNGAPPVVLAPGARFAFDGTPRLGENRVRVEARDAAGNTGSAEVRFVFGSALAAGLSHSAAVRDGALYTWGDNGAGQLGLIQSGRQARPVRVPGPEAVRAVVAGTSATLAVQEDGSVWAFGALPRGLASPRPSLPAPVVGAALGGAHALLLLEDGTVLAVGANDAGQLGLGHSAAVDAPTRVPGLSDIIRVAAGAEHSVALRADGTVFVWGGNDEGQLGNGELDDTPHPTPLPVDHLGRTVDVAAGRGHVLALSEGGGVRAWGLGSSGQLGHGKSGMLGGRAQPVEVLEVTGATSVLASANVSFALTADGRLWGWGQNSNAQLGDGTTAERPRPVRVQGLGPVRVAAPGALHALAGDEGEATFAWGANTSDQLGAVTPPEGTPRSAVPLRVDLP